MSRVAPSIPADSDLLCESCGYVLTGLPRESRCPECGTPIHNSGPETRSLPAWERRPNPVSFLKTTTAILLRPKRFFRGLAMRDAQSRLDRRFGFLHWSLAAALMGNSATLHGRVSGFEVMQGPLAIPLFAAASLVFLYLSIAATIGLTAWEAAYRGLRLPSPIVWRAMYYHAPHFVLVALVGATTAGGYRLLREVGSVGPETLHYYLYTLSAVVVVGAIYLFWTYWIAMRSVMFANA